MTSRARTFLRELREEVETHPGVNHVFLARCATSPFTREDYRVMGLQHFPLVGLFTTYMEWLLVNGPDSGSKQWLAKVLVDEYGEGSDGKDHSTLYREFLTACGVGPGEEDLVPLDPRVVDFIHTHMQLVTRQPFLMGLGALGPGHEWAIPKMFPQIIEGLQRAGFGEEEISYFTLHISQDEDHGRWLEEALADRIQNAEDEHLIRAGALQSLEARRRFWDGVQSRVVAWRQPNAFSPVAEQARLWLGRRPGLGRLARRLHPGAVVYRPEVRKMAGVEA